MEESIEKHSVNPLCNIALLNNAVSSLGASPFTNTIP
jgi:hypothetical protein